MSDARTDYFFRVNNVDWLPVDDPDLKRSLIDLLREAYVEGSREAFSRSLDITSNRRSGAAIWIPPADDNGIEAWAEYDIVGLVHQYIECHVGWESITDVRLIHKGLTEATAAIGAYLAQLERGQDDPNGEAAGGAAQNPS